MAKWMALAQKMFGVAAAAIILAGCFSAPESGVTPTPDIALVAARQTIDAVLLGGNPDTPTPTPRSVAISRC
jgi:uncharacterized lipoprotein YajG